MNREVRAAFIGAGTVGEMRGRGVAARQVSVSQAHSISIRKRRN